MNISVNTQSSIKITGEKEVVYFDPWKLGDAPEKADVIFVTHDHYDHFSSEDIRKILKETTVLVVPEKMANAVLEETGIEESRLQVTRPGESGEAAGICYESVASYNIGKPFHLKNKGWCGYVVTVDGTRCFVTGDTDLVPEVASVNCQILLLPVGGTYTMNPEEAARCACIVHPELVIPTHYGDVVGTDEDGRTFARLVQEQLPEIRVEFRL